MSIIGLPTRTFNFQLSPNYAGPLDARSIGRSASDRPTTNLYEGFVRFETSTGAFVYATMSNNVWTWKPLLLNDSFSTPVTFNNVVTYLNTNGQVFKVDATNVESSVPLKATSLESSGNAKVSTLNCGGNATCGTLTCNGNATIKSLSVDGKVVSGNSSDVAYLASNVKSTLDSINSTLSTIDNRLAALERRRTTVLKLNAYGLYNFSDYRGGGSPIPMKFDFEYNPLNYTLAGDRVIIPTPGTYRVAFDSMSLADRQGKDDAYSVYVEISNYPFATDALYTFAYGFNQWNGGGFTRHQATIFSDFTSTRGGPCQVFCNLAALDGEIMWGWLLIQRLD